MQNRSHTNTEINRQHDLLFGERWSRVCLSIFAILLTAFYLPLWVILLCIVGNVAGDLLCMHYMRALSPYKHPARYRAVLAFGFLRELALATAAALVWQHTENYGQALAIGIIMAQLLQLAMLRAIHLPFGHIGILAVTLPTLASNTYFWTSQDTSLYGLLISTTAALAALAYTLVAMHSNHRMHTNFAIDRAAALAGEKAKSRFLAQMSHELRTPLNAILGMGHAELRRNKDALSQNRLSVLIASAEGLSTILDDILDMSAIDAGRLPIREMPVSPRSEILATIGLFQPGIAAAGLKVSHDIGPDLGPALLLDPQRLRQCLSNLLSNALKNTSQGGIHVNARLIKTAGGPVLLRIEVADTGPGIPQDMQREIFEPFSQARNMKTGMEGNGLGLSICRSMARHMGGDLTLSPDTPEQTGARFILTIATAPVPAAPQPAPQPATGPHRPAPADKQNGGLSKGIPKGLSVLVIDDIATNRLVASTYLRMLGATMIEATSGNEALEIMRENTPDLVLLDLNMPVMNGLEVLERIRALPAPAGTIPVIAMTADAMEEHRTFYLEKGMDGYLAKPVNPTRIEAEISSVLGKRAASTAD